MQIVRWIMLGSLAALGACGGTESESKAPVATVAAKPGPHAHAVTRQFTIDMGKLVVEERKYVDGMSMRLKDGAGAVLTESPLSACTKLAVSAHGDLDFDAAFYGEKPALLLVRNEEHPQGAILLIEPYSTTTLEDSFPALVTDGDTLSAAGDIGDAGWGTIDPTQYGGEKSPHVRLDVKLPFASIADADPLAADASPEAKWLRETRARAAGDTQAVVDASLKVDKEEYSGSSSSNAWSEVLGGWSGLNVIAVATDKDCATMVLREPGAIGGYHEAIIQTGIDAGVRKVTSAQTRSVDSIEGDYVIGRAEHPGLGAFPILHARAVSEEGVGNVIYFSDKPIAAEPFKSMITRQHVLRAVSGVQYGEQYSFSYYEFGGPGVEVGQIDAGNSTTNPHIDDKEISGLIRFGEGEGASIVLNFRLALNGTGP